MSISDNHKFSCPHCAGMNFFTPEYGPSNSRSIQDCEVCCRPIVITVHLVDGELKELRVEKENE